MKKTIKLKIYKFILSCFLLSLSFFTVFSFYTEDLRPVFDGSKVTIELLFDKLETEGDAESPLAVYQKTLNAEYDPTADWGSEKNPYIISNIKYLENLSVLQNNGYFVKEKKFYPYFLVCTSDYKPVIIDGTDITISPIGSSDTPFIGSIKGIRDETVSMPVNNEYSSDISTIYNLKVESDTNNVHDIGLFSFIGHTGDKSNTSTKSIDGKNVTTFEGTPSDISDLLLVDVSVASSHSLAGDITSWLNEHLPFLTGNYTDSEGNEKTDGKKDTHHLGILAGHVEYANIKNISVYYTNDDICAINLNANGSNSNFYSSTGIIGAPDNINPTFDGTNITINSGVGGDLNYSNSTGGGKLSGGKQGIVNAKELYDTYKYDSSGNAVSTTLDDYSSYTLNQLYTNSLEQLVQKKTMSGLSIPLFGISWAKKDYYYFYDGVFTFALSNTPDEDKIKNIWPTIADKEMIPSITCGEENEWTYGQLDASGYVATLSPLTSSADAAGKTVVMCYKDNSNNLYCMNLKSPTTESTLSFKEDGGEYKINCGTNKNFLDDYKMLYTSKGEFQNPTATDYHLGVKSTGYGSNAKFALYYGNNADTGQSNISGLLLSTPSRYTNIWSLGSSNNSLQFSISASYNSSRSGLLNIVYAGASATKYLTTTDTGFQLSDSNTSIYEIQLCTVDIQWTSFDNNDPNAKWGYLVPGAAEPNSGKSFKANEYVLKAKDEFHNGVGSNNNTLSYDLTKISDLELKSYDGNSTLSSLEKQFSLKDGIDIGDIYKWFGITYYQRGIVNAPIGSDGTATDMPTGTIAFKVNKIPPSGSAKINVIVSACNNESQSFGLWKVETTQGYFGINNTEFDKTKPLKSFVIPNTKPLIKDDLDKYYNVYVNGEAKRTYLNGDTVLVAHTFEVTETGVYIIGATNGPMNICYFSADGVASTAVSQIGSVDFVYSSPDADAVSGKKKIVSVNQVPAKNEDGTYVTDVDETNYNLYYYPSLLFAFTNQAGNPTININYEQLFVRRFLSGTAGNYLRNANISVKSANTTNNYIDVSNYSQFSDIIALNRQNISP